MSLFTTRAALGILAGLLGVAPAAPAASPQLPHSFPSGPMPALNAGKKF